MHAIHGAAQDVESARAAIVLIAAVLVIFWRFVLRAILMIIAIAVVVLVGSGALVLLQSMHR
jgi:predicted RND superfamily exporter protein